MGGFFCCASEVTGEFQWALFALEMAQNRRRIRKQSLIPLKKFYGHGLLLAVISSPLQEICYPPPQLGRSTVNAFAGAPAPEDSKEERRFS